MNRSTLGIVLLGVCVSIGVGLFVGGCQAAGSWYPMFAIIPILCGGIALYGIHSTGDGAEAGWVSFDTWVFLLVVSLSSALGLPLVLFHVALDDPPILGIILESAGCLVSYIGFLLHAIVPRLACGDDDGLLGAYTY
jgi:hypothetical protein